MSVKCQAKFWILKRMWWFFIIFQLYKFEFLAKFLNWHENLVFWNITWKIMWETLEFDNLMYFSHLFFCNNVTNFQVSIKKMGNILSNWHFLHFIWTNRSKTHFFLDFFHQIFIIIFEKKSHFTIIVFNFQKLYCLEAVSLKNFF